MAQLELQKSELEAYLLTISVLNPETGKLVGGLLNEPLILRDKRRLQKIHKILLAPYKEMIDDIKELQKECGEDAEKFKVELDELLKETVKVEFEPVSLAGIENVSSSANYNFDIIEKIAL